jgi:diguanylate cyclase
MILDSSPRIVVVDDSEDDYFLIAHQIMRELPQAKISHAINFHALITALDQGVDLVVCDYSMQELTHDQVVDLVSGYQPAIPLILMSGLASEALGIRAMNAGVRDYVEKSRPERLIPVILRELNTRKLHHNIQQLEKAQQEAAFVDQSTGFLNHTGLKEALQDLMDSPLKRRDVCLLSIHMENGAKRPGIADSDRIRELQDELVLRVKTLFADDLICKWADKLFVVVVDRMTTEYPQDLLSSQTELQSERLFQIEQELNQAQLLGALPIRPEVRVGLARLHLDGLSAESLIDHAQSVAAVLHKQGLPLNEALNPNTHQMAKRRRAIQTGLAQGIENDELTLMFQPIEDLLSQKVSGLEALVRWEHPNLGLVMPDEFIEVAEDSGLIESLGLWVIGKASERLLHLHAMGHPLWCAVNCSASQMLKKDFANEALSRISDVGLSPEWIEFEITESAAISDMAATISALTTLRKAGSKVAMDDFGTGYASLNYLRRLPMDVLKIDKSFVMDLEESDKSRKIVRAVIDLAHALDLTVHAEGIENEAQRVSLIEMGCDRLQGYLLGKPMEFEQLKGWLHLQSNSL